MIVWCLLLSYIVILRLIKGDLSKPQARKNYLINVGVVTALIVGCRGNNYQKVYDLTIYGEYFSRVVNTPWDSLFSVERFEKGFAVFTKLLTLISTNPQTIIFASSIICVGGVSFFIYRNTKHVFEAFFFFVTLGTLGFMMSGIRQSIAIAVGLFALDFVRCKKIIPFMLMCLLAISFHRTAIVLGVSYFLVNNPRLRFRSAWLSFVFIGTIIVFAPVLLEFGRRYEDEFYYEEDAMFSFNGIVPIIIYIICILVEAPRWRRLLSINVTDAKNFEHLNRLPLMSAGIGIYFLRFFNRQLERLALYYTPVSLLCLADFTAKMPRYIRIVIFILSFALFWRRFSAADYGNYIFFWNL